MSRRARFATILAIIGMSVEELRRLL